VSRDVERSANWDIRGVRYAGRVPPPLLGLYGLLVVSLGGWVLRSLAPRTERTVRPMDKRVVPTAVAPEVPKAA